jgi:SAM-dependent methyltransferase
MRWADRGADPRMRAEGDFDRYARSYEAIHARNLEPGGEPPAYYAAYKQREIERILGEDFSLPVLDFGCGVGVLTALLSASFPTVHGYDPSAESVRLAKERAKSAQFFDRPAAMPQDHYGAVILANVLHHVDSGDRPEFLRGVTPLLRAGGTLIVFEHNPLNPLTRRVVSACPFDDGAHLLRPREVVGLLRGAGLSRVTRDFVVFFPRALRMARPLEPLLRWLPLGAQVCVRGVRD